MLHFPRCFISGRQRTPSVARLPVEREGSCFLRVKSSGVEQGDRHVLGLEQQTDLGAAENDGPR